jgi:hypothetical protein
VVPGDYTAVLTVNGGAYSQPITVEMDPRVPTSREDLVEQFELSRRLYEKRFVLAPIGRRFDSLVTELAKAKERAAQNPVKTQLEAFTRKMEELGPPNTRPGAPLSFGVLAKLEGLFGDLQEADVAPTSRFKSGVAEIEQEAHGAIERWQNLLAQDLPELNRQLEAAGLTKLDATTTP